MARFTRDEMHKRLTEVTAQDTVYKVEADDLKYHLSTVYDDERSKIGRAFTHGGQWQSLSETERSVDLPFELRHVYGKKFSKSLEAAKEATGEASPYLEAIEAMVTGMQPLHDMMQGIIARQVKGRRPPEPKVVIATRTQLRAICPQCFREQAVKDGKMVSHGYTLDYGFQNGICQGHGRPHFGTEEGRDFAREGAGLARGAVADLRTRVAEIRAGRDTSSPIYDSKHRRIEDPTPRQIEDYCRAMEYSARSTEQYAEFVEGMVAKWKPAEPVEHQIEVTE